MHEACGLLLQALPQFGVLQFAGVVQQGVNLRQKNPRGKKVRVAVAEDGLQLLDRPERAPHAGGQPGETHGPLLEWKASWPATATYLAATATQKTIASQGDTESDLYYFGTDFGANGDDGDDPVYNGMVFDSAGNIYAATARDLNNASGAVVKLSPTGGGTWNETLLYVFNRTSTTFSGWIPQGSLAIDSKGNLYGTTKYGAA